MTSIFISYSRKDETFARELATALANIGADIWIDVEDIPAGMKWSTAIQQGLDTSDALIVVISPESMASRNVEDEWQYALDQGKPVIPILLREAKVHFQLNRIQWIDFLLHPFDIALVDLHEELGRNGVHLKPPPRPAKDSPKLTHGHAPPPAPKTVPMPTPEKPNRTMLYVGGAIAVMIGLVLLGFIANSLLNPNDITDTQATIDAQNVRLDELELLTAQVSGIIDTQATINAQSTDSANLVATQTAQSQVVATNIIVPTATNTILPTQTPTTDNILAPVTDNDDWTPIMRVINDANMVLVPAGRFTMGATRDQLNANLAVCILKLGEDSCRNQLNDETNGASVTISDPYWIDQYEVSAHLYDGANSNMPQVNITSHDAQVFCESRGGSLPSETQWEYAAKGPSNWRYPWGNSWDLSETRANICDVNCSQNWREEAYDDGHAEGAFVDSYPESASWVGAYHMAGNVWEWTSDFYSTTNVLRGGSWTWVQGEATTTSRANGIADEASFYGFRCVMPYTEGDLERYGQ
ncbi:MAG: hypothetical protein Phog2KO_44770 [Phototrophicaceae bacterium]